jgi:nicotinamidase/pyrazinamidase
MLRGPQVFVDVDTQRDFLEPSGALYVPGSAAIVGNLARLTLRARVHDIPVLATACAHAVDDPDPEPFPPHCLIGTRGQERIEATSWPGGTVVARDSTYNGGVVSHLTVQKRYYDAFSHPAMDGIVALYNTGRPTFVVYGVATDYCVRANVFGLLERGFRVAVVADAVRAVFAEAEPKVLTELARRGAVLTLTDVVCGPDLVGLDSDVP